MWIVLFEVDVRHKHLIEKIDPRSLTLSIRCWNTRDLFITITAQEFQWMEFIVWIKPERMKLFLVTLPRRKFPETTQNCVIKTIAIAQRYTGQNKGLRSSYQLNPDQFFSDLTNALSAKDYLTFSVFFSFFAFFYSFSVCWRFFLVHLLCLSLFNLFRIFLALFGKYALVPILFSVSYSVQFFHPFSFFVTLISVNQSIKFRAGISTLSAQINYDRRSTSVILTTDYVNRLKFVWFALK